MALFKKKMEQAPARREDCPVCGEPLVRDHCTEAHTQELPSGGFIFVCICGVSTRKWDHRGGAGEGMSMHLDRDHGTRVSIATELGFLDSQYLVAFPDGRATQPQQVGGTPQSLIASASRSAGAQPSLAPQFNNPEDATRWKMVHAVHSSLVDTMDKYQLCFEKANQVEKAFGMANAEFVDGVRHREASREAFRNLGVESERELEGLLQDLRAATATAQSQWNDLLFLLPGEDNDIVRVNNWCEANGVDSEVWSQILVNAMLVYTDFGSTRASFWTENTRVMAVLNKMNDATQQG